MYSIIIKESDIGIFDDYDVIPSKWILSKSTCMYPPNLLKYRAKRNADVQDFWTQMNIKIITDGHSNYERAMEDCLRLSKGRLTKSGSEAEEKGVGCRAKKCTVLFSPGSSPSKKKQKVAGKVASSCLKSKLKLNFPKPPATDKTDFLQKETRKAFTSSNTNVQGSNQTPKQPKKSTPTSKPQMNVKTSKTDKENREAFPELDSIPIRASKPQMNSQTPKTHKESKEASQEVVSTPLRAIEALLVDVSRDVKKLKATVSDMQADLKSLIEIEKLRGVPNVINANTLDEFPFSSVDKLIEFDDKLKANPQLCQQVVSIMSLSLLQYNSSKVSCISFF
ncbi:uncharacterized protein [Bemisia tabaci]